MHIQYLDKCNQMMKSFHEIFNKFYVPTVAMCNQQTFNEAQRVFKKFVVVIFRKICT